MVIAGYGSYQMIGIVFYAVVLLALFHYGFYIVGFMIATFTALNGILAAFYAVRNPVWYAQKRAMLLREPEYTSLFGPCEERLRRDIVRLLLVKLVSTVPLVAAAALFAYRAWL